jgi:hypothetical protein
VTARVLAIRIAAVVFAVLLTWACTVPVERALQAVHAPEIYSLRAALGFAFAAGALWRGAR